MVTITMMAERFEDGTIDGVQVLAFGLVRFAANEGRNLLALIERMRIEAGAPVPARVAVHGDVAL